MRPEHERTKHRVCSNKTRYETRAEARRAIRSIRRRDRVCAAVPDGDLNCYRCPFSNESEEHFHVGHPPSLEGMKRIADAMRDLEPGRPSPEYA